MFTEANGHIEVICGSMFSGKSEELIRRIKRAQIARLKVQVFKPAIDQRFSLTDIVSHSGFSIQAVLVNEAREILEKLKNDTQVIAIDEIQFFSKEIIKICQKIANMGKRVIAAGLDQDFRGEPFGPIPFLLAVAEKVDKFQAICVICGASASRSQRIINEMPAGYDSPIVLVGASEYYEARCRKCHQVPKAVLV
ncbi:MAG: thymidine kinase [Armatimonadetes bacterium]|nr:thymidine kinase [Armatimonadota bacterium]